MPSAGDVRMRRFAWSAPPWVAHRVWADSDVAVDGVGSERSLERRSPLPTARTRANRPPDVSTASPAES